FMPTSSGRNRYNVLGAIHAVTHHLITLCNETYVNANVICELLLEIRKTHRGEIPVTLVMDNAKYQRCSVVMESAEKLKIELLFLPAYSPNLNLIERLWKWVKKDCLYCRYYESFSNFKKAIDETLQKVTLQESKKELNSLLTLKFQSFNNVIYSRV
ncbi:hypothetical protein EZS27_036843, partial [termite gut metagenome]